MAADQARFFSVLQQFELGQLDVAVTAHQPQQAQRWLSEGGTACSTAAQSQQQLGKFLPLQQHLRRISVRRTLTGLFSMQTFSLAASSVSRPPPAGPSPFEQLPECMMLHIMFTAMDMDVRLGACLACTGTRQHGAYLAALASGEPRWAVEVAGAAADMRRRRREEDAKRQLVRRLTLDSHRRYVHCEFKLWALGQCVLAVAAACVVAAEQHHWSFVVPVLGINAGPLVAFCTFAGIHAMAHSGLLAMAYYISSAFGVWVAAAAGCVACMGVYASGAMLCKGSGVRGMQEGLAPAGQLTATLLGPLLCAASCGTWRAVHVASAGFSWAFGVCEWWQEFRRMLARHGL